MLRIRNLQFFLEPEGELGGLAFGELRTISVHGFQRSKYRIEIIFLCCCLTEEGVYVSCSRESIFVNETKNLVVTFSTVSSAVFLLR